MSVFLAVVYAVVPLSIWRRKRSLRWRIPIGITFVFGYGWIILGFVFAFPSTGGLESQMPWYIPLFFSLTAGFFFLPLAAIGSITMLRERLETRSQQNS
ncbi:MAG: hypothetical protein P1U85_17375 [Verrucomicrobiales bacterium]|nr:hypothetical protein [Verrucomicrobiales bacterium]